MGLVYLGALVASLGILVLQLVLGGKDVDAAAHGLDHEGLDGNHLGKDLAQADAGVVALFASTRFWIFAALGFGLSGSLIHYLALAGVVATAIIAGGAGLSSGLFAALAFRAVRRASVSTTAQTAGAAGRVGKVLVACSPGKVGQIRVELVGSSVDLMATTDEEEIPRGADVLVVEVRGEVAHVAKRPTELD